MGTPFRLIIAEDQACLGIASRILQDARIALREMAPPCLTDGVGGFWEKLKGLQAPGGPDDFVFALADADTSSCIGPYLKRKKYPKSPRFVVRLAVVESESWLLSDHEACRSFFGMPKEKLPQTPDSLKDPKKKLVQLAALSSSKDIRVRLCPLKGSHGDVGREYNSTIREFIESAWSPARARTRSPSLDRALKALAALKKARR